MPLRVSEADVGRKPQPAKETRNTSDARVTGRNCRVTPTTVGLKAYKTITKARRIARSTVTTSTRRS